MDGGQQPDSTESTTGEGEERNTLYLHFKNESCATMAAPLDTVIHITSCNPLKPNNEEEGDKGNTLDLPLRDDHSEMEPLLDGERLSLGTSQPMEPYDLCDGSAAPMYNVFPITSPGDDYTDSTEFTKERVFRAASQGDKSQLHGLLDYLKDKEVKLSSEEFTDKEDGETVLMRAFLHLKDGKNDTIEELLDIAEKTGDLEKLINASFKNSVYNGQTALHIAIERRSFDHVKLLVQKGADVQAKADGKFFQDNEEPGFYFGELPLSLAACTNQPDIVSFLIDNEYRSADLTDQDSQGNTVLHALVVIADNETENTDMFASMYDSILIQHNKLEKKRNVQLEAIGNKQGLTPLKLAANLGKIGLFEHMLHREFKDKDTQHLSRKLPGWRYGPVQSSLYDMSSIDTNEENSVLEIVVYWSVMKNRPEMLQIEPLRSILQDKWDRFASKLFLMNFLIYVVYLSIFTAVAYYRKQGQPPFPLEVPLDYLRCIGEIISVLGAVWFIYKGIGFFKRNHTNSKTLYNDGLNEILFLLQALFLLIAAFLYFCGQREYVGLLVLSLALAWINVLYYSRGSKQLGIYNIMIQRMVLGDLLNFLFVYSVLLFGFSAAVVALMINSPPAPVKLHNGTLAEGTSFSNEPLEDEKPSYKSFSFTLMEMFKFTIGMGNLEFTDQVLYKEVFYVLLILYIILTYILLLNMIIALMGTTVERITLKSKNLWNLQKAFVILDMERSLPMCLKSKLYEKVSSLEKHDDRRFIRVDEMQWGQWRSDLGVFQEESMMKHHSNKRPGNRWTPNSLLERIRAKYQRQQISEIP